MKEYRLYMKNGVYSIEFYDDCIDYEWIPECKFNEIEKAMDYIKSLGLSKIKTVTESFIILN